MYKKKKSNSFQLFGEPEYTKLPTFNCDFYKFDMAIQLKKEHYSLGTVTKFPNDASLVVTLNLSNKEIFETIIHESVHIKQFIESRWNTTLDKETEAIVVCKTSTFLMNYVEEYKKNTKKRKK